MICFNTAVCIYLVLHVNFDEYDLILDAVKPVINFTEWLHLCWNHNLKWSCTINFLLCFWTLVLQEHDKGHYYKCCIHSKFEDNVINTKCIDFFFVLYHSLLSVTIQSPCQSAYESASAPSPRPQTSQTPAHSNHHDHHTPRSSQEGWYQDHR